MVARISAIGGKLNTIRDKVSFSRSKLKYKVA